MFIKDIKDLEPVFALKRLCIYLVQTGWNHVLDNDEVGAELNLAVARSKRYEDDIKILAKLDSDLDWGHTKHKTSEHGFYTTGGGDFNPWYTGSLKLEELLDSVAELVEFLEGITPPSMDDAEFIHYKHYLVTLLPKILPVKTKKNPPATITFKSLHPKIVKAVGSLYETHHYSQAILEAYKVVFQEIKDITGIRNLDGKKLAEKAFAPENPVIKLSPLTTESEQDEQKGFMLLLSGAALGIRNPKAHDLVVQKDEYRALEYLSFASLLLTRIDEKHEVDKTAHQNKPVTSPKSINGNASDLPYVYLSGGFGGNGHNFRLSACTTYNLSDNFIILDEVTVLGGKMKFSNTIIKSGESIAHTGIDGLSYPSSDKDLYLEIHFRSKHNEKHVSTQKLKLQARAGDDKYNVVGLSEPSIKRVKS